MAKFKYALYINDVLIEYFNKISDIDAFIENYIGYKGKIEIKKLR